MKKFFGAAFLTYLTWLFLFSTWWGNAANAGTDPSNTFRLGNGSAGSDKKFILNIGTLNFPQILWSHSSQTWSISNDGLSFTSIGQGPGQPYDTTNLGLSDTVAGGSLTVALKQKDGTTNPSSGSPLFIGFRGNTPNLGQFNERSITSALSVNIAAATTLGLTNSTNGYVWVYGVDSDGLGTIKLAVSSQQYDESSLQNVVTESAALASISNSSPAVFTLANNGLLTGDAIQLTTNGTLPTGLSTLTTYYVQTIDGNTFQVSLTAPSGSPVNTSSSGTGVHTFHIAGTRLASNGNYLNAPVHLLGRMLFNLSTVGNWNSTASELSLNNFSMQLPGSSVVSGSAGIQKMMAAYFDNGANGACTSSPCVINYQTGTGLAAVSRLGTGNYQFQFLMGVFNGPPLCICNATVGGGAAGVLSCFVAGAGLIDSLTVVQIQTNLAGTPTDALVNLQCMGNK